MPGLSDSSEWRLLQRLAALMSPRKTTHHALPRLVNDPKGTRLDADLLEYELRQTFRVQELPPVLSHQEFEFCQEALQRLCSLLDSLISYRSAESGRKHRKYTHLRTSIIVLESTSGAISLINDPGISLFKLPDDAAVLRKCTRVVTECNNVLNGLLTPSLLEPVIQPSRAPQAKSAWKKSRIRDQAIHVLRTVFEHFRCGVPHEILLRLTGDPNKDLIFPSLQLMLSSCPELELWQEAQWGTNEVADASISSIPDICTGLRQNTGQGKALMLHVEGSDLYGAWAGPISRNPTAAKEPLDQLIKNGVFKRPDVKALKTKAASVIVSTQEKRKLAVKLGYCLMDFFDADFNANRIHFLGSSKSRSRENPYLAFSSTLSCTEDSYSFQMGHPTLLSFAKLLLEVELGQMIELEVSPDSNQNLATWAELLGYVDILDKKGNDSYLQAIRSCLLVYRKIAKKLDSCDYDDKDADSRIRKIIYQQIVWKLELGLTESTPRQPLKRQRSESPPALDHRGVVQNLGSETIVIRSAEPRHTSFRSKKRRAIGFSQLPSRLNIASSLLENMRSLKNGILKSGAATSLDRPSSREDFEIALICALQIETDAVEALFDSYYEEDYSYGKAPGDPNAYTTGRMAGHNVVLGFMPGMGKVNSANVAAGFRMSFANIKLGIVVGICGGIPGGRDGENEVLLGDIIISTALKQYDFGRQYDNGTVARNTLEDNFSRPNMGIRSFLSKCSGLRGRKRLREKTLSYLEDLCARDDFKKSSYPGADKDVLYRPDYRHKHRDPNVCNVCANCQSPYDEVCDVALESSCTELGCEDSMTVSRGRVGQAKGTTSSTATRRDNETRDAPKPSIHFGTIACGDSVMKSGLRRDEIALREKVIAFEMEGAGVWDSFPTVVIKSVCDYADSHKNKMWQRYAAVTAAACSKAFLEEWKAY
ncbi:hypothetical protein ACHAPE_000569 [Trichoderma viride]